jgi:hypothetical protein
LNVDGFFDGLLRFLAHAAEVGFIRPQHLAAITASSDPPTLLDLLVAANP